MNSNLEKAKFFLSKGRDAEAKEAAQKAIAGDPENHMGFLLLAASHINLKEYGEALNFAKQAVGMEPDSPLGYMILAQASFYNKELREAQAAIRAGLNLAPYEDGFYELKSEIAFYEEHWEMALKEAEAGLEIAPENTNLLNLRTRALVKLDRKEQAFETIDFALHNSPENSYSHANKGWIQIEQDKYDEAVATFKEALRLDPTNEYARTGLKEAIKGKNILYRGVLKYFLWMQKLSEEYRWGVVIGAYVLYRIIAGIAESTPSLAPLLYPIMGLYIMFVFSSWIGKPLADFFLRFHPFGKYALSDDETLASNLVGIVLVAAVVILGLGWLMPTIYPYGNLWLLGMLTMAMLIPIGGTFSMPEESKSRKNLTYYSLGLAVCAYAGFFLNLPELFMLFGLGIFGFGWVANYLISKEAKEF